MTGNEPVLKLGNGGRYRFRDGNSITHKLSWFKLCTLGDLEAVGWMSRKDGAPFTAEERLAEAEVMCGEPKGATEQEARRIKRYMAGVRRRQKEQPAALPDPGQG